MYISLFSIILWSRNKGTHSQTSNQTLTNVLTKLLQMFLPKQNNGRYNHRLVRDTREGVALGHKDFCVCTDLKYICGAWKAYKKLTICGTQASNR
jgi:hypothetical protein